MKLNLGCGAAHLDGYVNVDVQEPADVVGDIRTLTFEDVEMVEFSHTLEHLPWPDTIIVLQGIRSWMRPGGLMRVEVPDMQRIVEMGVQHPKFLQYVYGAQPVEQHLTGFSEYTLRSYLKQSGWNILQMRCFLSDDKHRLGMPCVEAVAEVR